MKTKKSTDIIEDIADCLLEDHIELMNENNALRSVIAELLDEHYPASCYTDEMIEYEMSQGNMCMPMVKRAYALIRGGGARIKATGEKE